MTLRIKVHERIQENFNPKTVKIGNQVWMAENLDMPGDGAGVYYSKEANTTFYTDGAISRIVKNIPGWRLPTEDDCKELIDFLGGKEPAYVELPKTLGLDTYGWWESTENSTRLSKLRDLGSNISFWTYDSFMGFGLLDWNKNIRSIYLTGYKMYDHSDAHIVRLVKD